VATPKKLYRLPKWIWNPNFRILTLSEKIFYAYLFGFGPDTCWEWNWRLAERFGVTERTIQRWLSKLKDNGFIWIQKPYGKDRKLHARPFPSAHAWITKLAELKLKKVPRAFKRNPHRMA